MKIEECKKCDYHFKAQLDGIVCEYSGFDCRVITRDKKGHQIVIVCPLDMPLSKKQEFSVSNFKSQVSIF